jgi:hypothetical protein
MEIQYRQMQNETLGHFLETADHDAGIIDGEAVV